MTVRPAVSLNSAGTAAWTMHARPAPTIRAPITTAPAPCSAQLIPSDFGWSWKSRASISIVPSFQSLMVAPAGLEPATFGLGNRCSILLSYGAFRRPLGERAARINSPPAGWSGGGDGPGFGP